MDEEEIRRRLLTLTKTQLRVLFLRSGCGGQPLTIEEIAGTLHYGSSTVWDFQQRAFVKLGINDMLTHQRIFFLYETVRPVLSAMLAEPDSPLVARMGDQALGPPYIEPELRPKSLGKGETEQLESEEYAIEVIRSGGGAVALWPWPPSPPLRPSWWKRHERYLRPAVAGALLACVLVTYVVVQGRAPNSPATSENAKTAAAAEKLPVSAPAAAASAPPLQAAAAAVPPIAAPPSPTASTVPPTATAMPPYGAAQTATAMPPAAPSPSQMAAPLPQSSLPFPPCQQALYDFEQDLQGWQVIEQWQGGRALTQSADRASGAKNSLRLEVDFRGGGRPENWVEAGASRLVSSDWSAFTGVSIDVYAPVEAPYLIAQTYVKWGPQWAWAQGPDKYLTPGQWTRVDANLRQIGVGDPRDIRELGLKVGTSQTRFNGPIYVDNVCGWR